jgi:hypothetical protein
MERRSRAAGRGAGRENCRRSDEKDEQDEETQEQKPAIPTQSWRPSCSVVPAKRAPSKCPQKAPSLSFFPFLHFTSPSLLLPTLLLHLAPLLLAYLVKQMRTFFLSQGTLLLLSVSSSSFLGVVEGAPAAANSAMYAAATAVKTVNPAYGQCGGMGWTGVPNVRFPFSFSHLPRELRR